MLKALAKFLLSLVDFTLSPLVPLVARPPSPRSPSIFIIGGPRSGSTLLYQALLHCRRFAFINNTVAHFPRSAPVFIRLLRVGRWPVSEQFTSDYGDTTGLASPSEAGLVWDHIFPWKVHHSVDAEEFPSTHAKALASLANTLAREYGAPFLAKNLWHSVRLQAIDHALPEALFIVVHRDPVLMAQSLLRGRRQALGDKQGLWSIRPREMVDLASAPSLDQVAYQLVFTYRAIDRARLHLGAQRFLDIAYEEFCQAPDESIEKVDNFLAQHGIRIEPRGRLKSPFLVSDQLDLEVEDVARLRSILCQQWPDYRSPEGAR